MQNGVLNPTRVLIDRHPVISALLIEGLRLVVGARVAQEIPGRVDKRIHRVRLPPRRLATFRAGGVDERWRGGSWVLAVGPRRVLAGADHPPDRQLVLARELEVATVMSGDAHDRAGAIAGQHVVGDPDRDSLLGEWIDRVGAGKDAGLFVLRGESLDFGFGSG